jgi:hypothetical protein
MPPSQNPVRRLTMAKGNNAHKKEKKKPKGTGKKK